MSGENMEQRIDVGEIPTGGVVPTEDQMARIDNYVEGGHMSHAEATMKVLGVMPSRVYEEPRAEEPPAPQKPVYDNSTKVANLTRMYSIESLLKPRIAKLSELTGDDWRKEQAQVKRAQVKRDNAMENACSACSRQDGCEIKAKGFEEGMAVVHPRLKPSEKYPHTNVGESLQEMIIRHASTPDSHCDPAEDGIVFEIDDTEQEVAPVIAITADEATLAVPLVDNELETAYEKRNEILQEASDFLNKSHRDKGILKYGNPANPTAVKKLAEINFGRFATKLEEACSICPDHGTCPIVKEPDPAKAWEDAHYYSDKASEPSWPNEVSENGIGHESRKAFFERTKQDPHAPCAPPAVDLENMPKVA